ncbi:NADPH-dependent glutamate synthase [bacterium]|nr:NADPH-dependent glutamate synthase [Candidatus Omnitrophota bacterium]MBU2529211.1 NADPH-dependent glutamate synthase [bacterium]MBU3930485.1 NADPH-dependent glutamate synthase [bacterium]MBU4122511.1 NADPH-dependent glutamate synthase [bacterium]
MLKNKTPMPLQPADVRKKNFDEVALGYSREDALREASRCLMCKNRPCVAGCPVEIDIPAFIQLIKEERFIESYEKIKETNFLPAVCGRVCPQEKQCAAVCTLGIKNEAVAIGRLERFAADYAEKAPAEKKPFAATGKISAAVIGSGPAGLTAAGELARSGFRVTVFEALHEAGGVMVYGIPEFRLPKSVVKKEIDDLRAMGVDFRLGYLIGRIKTIKSLFAEGYSAVFISTGAGLPRFMGIPGENSNGVYSANEFLTRINLMKSYRFPEYATPLKKIRNVVVVGGGNVAMDSARCAIRMGAENVYNVYRRTRDEMPARLEEVEHAEEEGVIFRFLMNPVEIEAGADGAVTRVKCVKMKLGDKDESGRARPVEIPGDYEWIEADTLVSAIGVMANPLLKDTSEGLKFNKRGYIEIDPDTFETSIKNVYAAGDIVSGAATVISAMGGGKRAADEIVKRFKGK